MYPVLSTTQWVVMREMYGPEEAAQRMKARFWADLGMTGMPAPSGPERSGLVESVRRAASSLGQAARSMASPNRPAHAELS